MTYINAARNTSIHHSLQTSAQCHERGARRADKLMQLRCEAIFACSERNLPSLTGHIVLLEHVVCEVCAQYRHNIGETSFRFLTGKQQLQR